MDISGSQKIKAPRAQVFQGLLNPTVLKNSVPGCEEAETFDTPTGPGLSLKISTSLPGFKGPYRVNLQLSDIVAPSHVVLNANPVSSMGSVKATCPIDLTEEADGTLLSYQAHAQLEGKIGAIPEFMLKGSVKGALDTFFKNFEKQVLALS